jgi:hypothetical protein
MSVLEKVSAETRRKTGWLLPAAAISTLTTVLPEAGEAIGRPDQLWFGGLGLAGVAIGLLWQWYSPRELAPRLILAAGAFVLTSILILLPLGDATHQANRHVFLGLGVISGLVIADWWRWLRTTGGED